MKLSLLLFMLFPLHVFANGIELLNENSAGIYRFADDGDFAASLLGEERESVQVSHSAKEAFHALPLDTGSVLITLKLVEEEEKHLPDTYIVSSQAFDALNIEFVAPSDPASLSQWESGYEDTEYASLQSNTRARARQHKVSGTYSGRSGNCVRVVQGLTGISVYGNGVNIAPGLVATKKYHQVSTTERIAKMVCSWSGGRDGKGHVGFYTGSGFVPTYKGLGANGDPGPGYHLYYCAVKNESYR